MPDTPEYFGQPADEWQYVLDGQVSVTMFGSGGRYRTETLETGDVRVHQRHHGTILSPIRPHYRRLYGDLGIQLTHPQSSLIGPFTCQRASKSLSIC